jgi:hypothetical protein
MKIRIFSKQLKTFVLALTAVVALAGAANAQEFGGGAGNGTSSSFYDTGFGYQALLSDTTGDANAAFGYQSLTANTSGYYNTAFGVASMPANTTGTQNTGIGNGALDSNTTGSYNTGLGELSLGFCISGNYNTSIGGYSLENSTGDANIALGYDAGVNLITGTNNIYIGNSGNASGTESGIIYIGTTGTHTATFIAGINGASLPGNPTNAVIIDSVTGQLGTVDVSTLVGPAGATGATGATGAQGPAGPTGPSGGGLVAGAYLFMPHGSAAPAGFNMIGTTLSAYKALNGHTKELTIDIYQKN